MFNLKLGMPSRPGRRATSSSQGTSLSGSNASQGQEQKHQQQQQEQNHGGWFQSNMIQAHFSTPDLNFDHDHNDQEEDGVEGYNQQVAENFDDPLIYRLQHQKQYLKEKQSSGRPSSRSNTTPKRGKEEGGKLKTSRGGNTPNSLQRSLSERGGCLSRSTKERDPFDLWGSFTSEEKSLGKSNHSVTDSLDDGKRSPDEGIDYSDDRKPSPDESIDVSGWESKSSRRGSMDSTRRLSRRRSTLGDGSRPSTTDLGASHHSRDDSIDVSGWESKSRKSCNDRPGRRRSSKILSDDKDKDGGLVDDGLVVDFGGVTPAEMKKARQRSRRRTLDTSNAQDLNTRFTSTRYRTNTTDSRSTCSSVTNSSTAHSLNALSVGFGGVNEEGSDDGDNNSPSHTDLANILSSLERESMKTPSPELHAAMSSPQRRRNSLMNDNAARSTCSYSTISSPTGKCQQLHQEEQHQRQQQRRLSNKSSPPTNPEAELHNQYNESSADSEMPLTRSMSSSLSPDSHDHNDHGQQHHGQQLHNDKQGGQAGQQRRKAPLTQKQPSPSTQLRKSPLTRPQSSELQKPPVSPSPRQKPPIPKPPQPQKRQIEEEEEDPRLHQLRQQTKTELAIELGKMQHQSKTNLEKSWAATEQLRCEVGDLDDQFVELKNKLANAREAMLSNGPYDVDQLPSNSISTSTSASQYIITKFCSTTRKMPHPSPPEQKFRRRRTIEGLRDSLVSDASSLGSDMGLLLSMRNKGRFQRSSSAKSLFDLVSPSAQQLEAECKNDLEDASSPLPDMDQKESTAKGSFRDKTNHYSAGALNALRSGLSNNDDRVIALTTSERRASSERSKASKSSSDRQRRRNSNGSGRSRKGFLGGLSQSLQNIKSSSGCSVGSNDFALSFVLADDDDDKNDYRDDGSVNSHVTGATGRSQEFDDKIFHSLLQGDVYSTPMHNDGDSSNAKSGVFYPPDRKCLSTHSFVGSVSFNEGDDDSSDARTGVFYPRPDDEDDEKQRRRPSNNSLTFDAPSVAVSEMDDFDFDPLNSFVESEHNDAKPKDRRGGFKRRPSFLSLFDGKIDEDDDDDSTSSALSKSDLRLKLNTKKEEKKEVEIKGMIVKKKKEIAKLTTLVRNQEEEIRLCESDITQANVKCDADFKEKDAKLQAEVDELEQRNSDIESRLDSVELSELEAREKESSLKKKLSNVNLLCKEREEEIELEKKLDLIRERHDTAQENEIGYLSNLLNDFDTICIPSLRREEEIIEDDSNHSGGVSGDIIAQFDDLTDKEEELVNILTDPDRLTSCQSTFQEIQDSIEKAMFYWSTQLNSIEAELRSHLITIKFLIKQEGGDEGTHTTESSTASERLSLERMFVKSIISHLESVKQNQGQIVLNALSKTVELLTCWDELLASSTSCSVGDFGLVADITSMLKEVIQEAASELDKVKSDVLEEHGKFQAKMQRAGIPHRPIGIFANCNINNNAADDNDSVSSSIQDNNGEQKQLKREAGMKIEEIISRQKSKYASSHSCSVQADAIKQGTVGMEAEEMSRQISSAERESLLNKFASSNPHPMQSEHNLQPLLNDIFGDSTAKNELEELKRELSTATSNLSDRETLLNTCVSDLNLMRTRAREDSRVYWQLTSEIQAKVKHLSRR